MGGTPDHPAVPDPKGAKTPDAIVEVAAGLVFRQGKLLITQRPAHAHLAGLWEFPGGKREPGESFVQCLTRELKEELGIEVAVGDVIDSITHHYPEKIVRLEFFHCLWRAHEPQALGCPAFRWIDLEELGEFQFPPADARLLDLLRRRRDLWHGKD